MNQLNIAGMSKVIVALSLVGSGGLVSRSAEAARS